MGASIDLSNTLDDSAAVELTGKIMVAAIIILFLVVVFVIFFHLYPKWFWWSVEDPSRDTRPRRRRRSFVFARGQDPEVAALRGGLDLPLLRSMPVLVFRSEEFKEGLECAVCLSELVEGEKARMLPKCNHGFHVDCIDMWFQSHSTCPLCRNSVASPDTSNSGNLESSHTSVSPQDNSAFGGVYSSSETPNFPTNVLFWGNQTQVSSGALCLDEGPSSQSPCFTSSSSSSSNRPDGMLVIDIPRQTASETFSSPSGSRYADEEAKSPPLMPSRLRSLKRLLSREKRVVV